MHCSSPTSKYLPRICKLKLILPAVKYLALRAGLAAFSSTDQPISQVSSTSRPISRSVAFSWFSCPPLLDLRCLGLVPWLPPGRSSAPPPGSRWTRPSPIQDSASWSSYNFGHFVTRVHRSCSWKCCFIFLCLPICYPCYITRTFRSTNCYNPYKGCCGCYTNLSFDYTYCQTFCLILSHHLPHSWEISWKHFNPEISKLCWLYTM